MVKEISHFPFPNTISICMKMSTEKMSLGKYLMRNYHGIFLEWLHGPHLSPSHFSCDWSHEPSSFSVFVFLTSVLVFSNVMAIFWKDHHVVQEFFIRRWHSKLQWALDLQIRIPLIYWFMVKRFESAPSERFTGRRNNERRSLKKYKVMILSKYLISPRFGLFKNILFTNIALSREF